MKGKLYVIYAVFAAALAISTLSLDAGAAQNVLKSPHAPVVVRFLDGSEGESKESDGQIKVHIKSGRVWINTSLSALNAKIAAGEIEIEAGPGVFDIEVNENLIIVRSIKRNAIVKISANTLVVPYSRELAISRKRIKERSQELSQLHYSKLAKEFPYFRISAPDEWAKINAAQDNEIESAYIRAAENEIKNAGAAITPDFLKYSALALTIGSGNRAKMEAARSFEYFKALLYAELIGDRPAAAGFENEFESRALTWAGSDAFSAEADRMLYRLAFVSPQSEMYPAVKRLRSSGGASAGTKISNALADALNVAYAGADAETRARAKGLLSDLGVIVEHELLRVSTAEADALLAIQVQFNDFLDSHSEFMYAEILRIGERIERRFLASAVSAEAAADIAQSLIAQKLSRMKLIKSLMEKGEAEFQLGRSAILLTYAQIEALAPAFSDAAVLAYFEEQTRAFAPFIAFLRTQEAETLRGSFEVDFEEFRTQVSTAQKVEELLKTAAGGAKIPELLKEALAAQVSRDLGGAGFTRIQIVLPESENDARVAISSSIFENALVSGIYDTERKILSDIILNSEEISYAIRLENIRTFLLIKLGKLSLSGAAAESFAEPEAALPALTIFEKVALQSLKSALLNAQINVDDKDFDFSDFENGIIHIKRASLTVSGGEEPIEFLFDAIEDAVKVTNLRVSTVLGEIPVNDLFSFAELPGVIEQIYKRAIFDKQKTEELKSLG